METTDSQKVVWNDNNNDILVTNYSSHQTQKHQLHTVQLKSKERKAAHYHDLVQDCKIIPSKFGGVLVDEFHHRLSP